MKLRLPALCLILFGSADRSLPAQATAPEPAALTALRASFLRQVMTDSQLLTEQYERALAKVEADIAAAGDYEEAQAIRQRREQLRALYTGTASSLATPLLLAQARLTGSTQASGETLSGWRSNNSGAEWQNFRLMPGSYHLEFEACMSDAPVAGSIYASSKFQPQQTATFEFNEVTLLGNATENRRSFEITRSEDEITFTTMRVGPLHFTRNPLTLRFATTAGHPANIIRIRNLRLVPVTEAATAAPPPPPTATTAAMQQATTVYKTALDSVKKTATDAYLTDLKQLAATKPALQHQIEAETRRLERLRSQTNGPAGIRAFTATTSGLDGFEDLSDAQLAAGEPISGDHFSVVHDGRTLAVRLLWVGCAPVNETDPGVKMFARHFDIEEEDAVAVGRAAREFTAGYLRDKPLRLLVRPDRDKDGTHAALLFLPNVGLYQNVLVDQGLAAVMPPQRDTRRNATERALITTLSARESAAKARSPPAGAWALSTSAHGGGKP